jgi:spermidine/putrescine transport system substrate-binding protein
MEGCAIEGCAIEERELPPPVRAAMRRGLLARRAAPTRRSLLAGTGAALGAAALGACGIPAASKTAGGSGTDDRSDKDKLVHFSNWPLYIDVDDKNKNVRPSLRSFTKATGIKVDYTEDISDNDAFFGKIQPELAAGQDTGRDLMVLTDWMVSRLIRLGWVEKLDPALLPHAYTNLEQRFRDPQWDPGRAYSYPWAGIQTVIAYNEQATKGRAVSSISQLLGDPSLKGRVTFLTEMRDTVGMTLLDMGKDPAAITADQYDAVMARLQKGVDSKQIRKFTGNEYGQELAAGDIAACVAWGGDLIQLQADNPHIRYIIPDSGYMSSTDNLVVPARAKHKKNAERVIDYYYRPEIAAELAAYVNYVSPVRGVHAELAKLDKEAAANPLILPDAAMTAKAHEFRALDADEEKRFEQKFSKLIGA